ncbi:hypothetical protein BOX15_Mlig022961g1 [Macrostomum lignano]|nr:hypothetical protein BOX15_Mlig022961g1 [Macrostomum lignano]
MYSVFDFHSNGDLRQLLDRFAEPHSWWSSAEAVASGFHLGGTRLRMATDIASAVEFLHATEEKSMARDERAGLLSFSFVHKDVKPSNILVDGDWRCRLADLDFLDLTTAGLGQTVWGEQRAQQVARVHTLGYRPPEDRVTCKWDVFSTGVTILELLTGLRGQPASSDTPEESWLCWALADGRAPPPQPGLRLSAGLHARVCREAVAPCLLHNFAERCTAAVLRGRLQTLLAAAEAEDGEAGLQEFSFAELDAAVRQVGEELGAGSFGRVYRVNLAGRPVAVKKLLPDSAGIPLEALRRQAGLRHPRLLSLLGFAHRGEAAGGDLLLVYELCEAGNLRQLIDDFAAGRAPPACEFQLAGVRIRMAHELASALDFLHSRQEVEAAAAGDWRSFSLAHQDVKSTNVLLTADWHCKLGDLDSLQTATAGSGLTRMEDRPQSSQPRIRYFTNGYFVPGEPDRPGAPGELLSCKVDVYALGVTLLELFTGRRASGGGEPELRLSLLGDSSVQQPPSPQAGLLISDRCYLDLCDRVFRPCLALNSAQRPTSTRVLQELDRFYSSCEPDLEN